VRQHAAEAVPQIGQTFVRLEAALRRRAAAIASVRVLSLSLSFFFLLSFSVAIDAVLMAL
jgi:hypothetical protein